MTILHWQGHTTTNICMSCSLSPDMIQHIYQCNHEGSRSRWTASADALRKFLGAWNTDPYISILLVDSILYIVGKINYLPQFTNINIHSGILRIVWPSKILGFIPTSLARTEQIYFTHIGIKKWYQNWPANSSHKYDRIPVLVSHGVIWDDWYTTLRRHLMNKG